MTKRNPNQSQSPPQTQKPAAQPVRPQPTKLPEIKKETPIQKVPEENTADKAKYVEDLKRRHVVFE